jgi:hypothetical protein
METLEHVPPAMVPGYLEALAKVARDRILITVPVERGIVFLAKHIAKELVGSRGACQYSAMDWVNSTLGRLDKIARHDHKGFDDRTLLDEARRYLDILRVDYLPGLPVSHANFSLAIEAKSKV